VNWKVAKVVLELGLQTEWKNPIQMDKINTNLTPLLITFISFRLQSYGEFQTIG